ncbi:MAG: hypothetical protein IT380_29695 [Myxococcales bacterium]|nr:hypothetical protein [Myxococcales bacterium]
MDAEARARAADLLNSFLEGQLTNDELERKWPSSSDPAVEEIRRAVWLTYDDDRKQFGPTSGHELIQRCAAFLRTTEPYSWPVPRFWQRALGACVGVMTLGAVKLRLAGPSVDAPWPHYPTP